MKGFTLVEMLVVIVILTFVFAISVPIVINYLKKMGDETYKRQIESIESAAEGWAAKNLKVLPENDGDFITIYLGELKNSGLIKENLKNPVSGEAFFDDIEIIITKTSGGYEFEVKPETGTGTTDFSAMNPVVALVGSSSEETEINVPYVEKGIAATDRFGKRITTYDIIYKSNSVEVEEIDTSRFGVYTVHYVVSGMTGDVEVVRTVEVTDTIAPILNIPADVSINVSEVLSYDLLAGVIVSDNSNEIILPQVTGNISTVPGIYQVLYGATDTSGNNTTKTRNITVLPEVEYIYNPSDPNYPVNATPCMQNSMQFTHLLDKRDNKTYPVTKIGNQCWLAANLAYTTPACLSTSWNYLENKGACRVAGGSGWNKDEVYYQLLFATNFSISDGVQGICPYGFHLPTDNNWKTLEMFLGMTQIEADTANYRGTNQGQKLKSLTPSWGGTNLYGFNAKPAGYISDSTDLPGRSIDIIGTWHSTTLDVRYPSYYWSRTINSSAGGINRTSQDISQGLSVRCLMEQ